MAHQRGDSEAKAAELERTGHPELAAQERAQQRERDLQFADSRLLGPDGRRRLPAAVQREEREKQRVAARIARFNRHLTRTRDLHVHGGSLISGASTDARSKADQGLDGGSLEGVSGRAFYDTFNPGAAAKEDWRNQFARKDRQEGQPKAAAAEEHVVTLKEILEVLSTRLPTD